jgi:hypothetical protein
VTEQTVIDPNLDLDQTQQLVRDRYAQAAIAAATSATQEEAATKSDALAGCCDDSCCGGTSATIGVGLYDAATREGLPDAALLASLG